MDVTNNNQQKLQQLLELRKPKLGPSDKYYQAIPYAK